MSSYQESLLSWGKQVLQVLQDFRFWDFLDILLVAFVVYNVIKLIRETRAIQLTKGLLILGAAYLGVRALNMQASAYVLERLFTNLLLVLIILFHPEIRHVLENVGRSSLPNWRKFGLRDQEQRSQQLLAIAAAVTKAAQSMREKKIGSLIVFERSTLLGDVIQSGTVLDAALTAELVEVVFYPNAPLHDGAAVIRGDRLYAAGCVLPLTDNPDLPGELGTRHRAALGMSEQSDAVVLVVSEESGVISLAVKGALRRELSEAELRDLLHSYLQEPGSRRQTPKGRKQGGGAA